MTKISEIFARLHREESGQDLIEYALIAALIALGSIITMRGVSNAISNAFSVVSSALGANVS